MATHPHEKAPAMPADLATDLVARFAPQAAVLKEAPAASWIERVRAFLATPAYGALAAAVVLAGIAVPMLSGPDTNLAPDTFRGGDPGSGLSAGSTRIVFVGDNAGLRAAIENSDDFEASAFVATTSGPRVIVDFTASSILAVDANGATVYQSEIPNEESEVSSAVAEALTYLLRKED